MTLARQLAFRVRTPRSHGTVQVDISAGPEMPTWIALGEWHATGISRRVHQPQCAIQILTRLTAGRAIDPSRRLPTLANVATGK